MEVMIASEAVISNSQSAQDIFVLEMTCFKHKGYFLEIGSNDPKHINNSYLLEYGYEWTGLMVEYESCFEEKYREKRPGSIFVIQDAQTVDYKGIFEAHNYPKEMDYLQIDLEVDNGSTLGTLERVETTLFQNGYKFAAVTFEHDIYRGDYFDTQRKSREIFERNGYIRVFTNIKNQGFPYEDWYIHPELATGFNVELLAKDRENLDFADAIRLICDGRKSLPFE